VEDLFRIDAVVYVTETFLLERGYLGSVLDPSGISSEYHPKIT
jgi:hypothetical protein